MNWMIIFFLALSFQLSQDLFVRLCASQSLEQQLRNHTSDDAQEATPSTTLREPAVLWISYTDARTGFQRAYTCNGVEGQLCTGMANSDPRYELVSDFYTESKLEAADHNYDTGHHAGKPVSNYCLMIRVNVDLVKISNLPSNVSSIHT